ncbi:MAG: tetratricopeptide repeat protein [Asticcacaulis sp.]
MSDIFDETEENLRADKWMAIAKKSWPWVAGVLGGALIIALGYWGYENWQLSVAHKASESYGQAVETLAKGDKAAARTQFEATVKIGHPAYKAMALQQMADLSVSENKNAQAINELDEAAKASHQTSIADAAALKAALLAMDTSSFADTEKRLTPLAAKDRPYAALAKEALAMAKLQAGNVKGARDDLQVLSVTIGTPDGVKQRAAAFVAAIDSGAIATAQDIMKQPEAAMPTLPNLQTSQMSQPAAQP